MTSPAHPGFGVDDSAPARAGAPRAGVEPWRVAVSAVIVAIIVAAIWLWGRPQSEPPPVPVAVTAEAWLAGQPPGAFEAAMVPQEFSGHFADADSIASSVVAFDVPAGTFVTPALLGPLEGAAGALTVMRLSADTSAWPEPGPRAGSSAVIAGVLGGCALDVTTLAGGAEGSIVVRVDAPGAARYARAAALDGLVVWPAPPEGWPECRSAATGAINPSPSGGERSSGFGNPAPSGFGRELPPAAPSTDPAGG